MVLDYSEKKTVREGLERKPLQKNRPRRDSSGGFFAFLSLAVLIVTFCAGVGTGWFLKTKTQKTAAAAPVAQPVKKDEGAPLAAQPQPAADAPLTFYKTLPAGGKGAIGTGLNLKKPEPPAAQHAAPAPAAAQGAAAAPAAPPAASAPPAPAAPAPAAPVAAPAETKQQQSTQYVVQIASYRSKAEADAARAKLAAKGGSAYVVETRVPDKGVWYRLRVGKHLGKREAEELASKYGKGSIILAE